MLKLYDYPGAPNPRRVKICAAEKGIELELVHCDILNGAQRTPEFMEKNASSKIPVLELPDGRCIPESVSICRYLETIEPEPNLFGYNPYERSTIDARERQIELEYWREIGVSWVNGPVIAKLGRIEQIPDAKRVSDAKVRAYFHRLDVELSRTEYIAGDRFTIADITLVIATDFAADLVELAPPAELANLMRWWKSVSTRPSVSGSRNAPAIEDAFANL